MYGVILLTDYVKLFTLQQNPCSEMHKIVSKAQHTAFYNTRITPNGHMLRHSNGDNINLIQFQTAYITQNSFLRTITALC
jgi:hypothetical protein